MRPIDVAEEIAAAVRVLSRHRLGAIIVWDSIAAVEGGVVLDARVSRELVVAIVVPEYLNQLHRGAVVVRGDWIVRAAVPLTWADVVERDAELGTGVAITVDEDDGEIRIVERTCYTCYATVIEPNELADVIRRHAREADFR